MYVNSTIFFTRQCYLLKFNCNKYVAGKKCQESCKKVFVTIKQKTAEIKCLENSKIKMWQTSKVANWWKGGKNPSKK